MVLVCMKSIPFATDMVLVSMKSVSFATYMVLVCMKSIPGSAIHMVLVCMKSIPFATDMVLVCMKSVPFATYMVLVCMKNVPFATYMVLLSQILGHSDQLYIKLPPGLRIWQVLLAVIFSLCALWAFVFPSHLVSVTFDIEDEHTNLRLPVRLFGIALILIFLTLLSSGALTLRWLMSLAGQGLCSFICLVFYWAVGGRVGSIKRCTSNKDLRDIGKDSNKEHKEHAQ
ncbi:hypothetical protein KUTeg_023740 [Tegillarca granosa]|uniref:Tumor protein p53-inducible protein 11 n=1 Tax=Tegillarca granosa TaxID=220873 RepID=A0ABQ9E853_TEGGR|nr:hypothetical protein KUTeg_023740 [Tegillarca granosa]